MSQSPSLPRRELSALTSVRTDPIGLDLSSPALCPEADKFAGWVADTLKEALTTNMPQDLDQALLRLTKEYLYRIGRVNHTHKGFACLDTVFTKGAGEIYEAQLSLIHRNGFVDHTSLSPALEAKEPEKENVQELYIGEEVGKD